MILANLCTVEGQVLLGFKSVASGSMKVILCQEKSLTNKLRALGMPLTDVDLD